MVLGWLRSVAAAAAEKVVRQDLKGLGWRVQDLAARAKKGGSVKLKLTANVGRPRQFSPPDFLLSVFIRLQRVTGRVTTSRWRAQQSSGGPFTA